MTLSSIPPQLIPEVDNETDEDEETRLLRSPRHQGLQVNQDKGEASTSADRSSPLHNAGQIGERVDEPSAKSKRTLFQQRRSITISTDEPLLPLKDMNSGRRSPFSKSPTSPSAILAKFKERIQQSLFLTSTEWPSAAAILQDRRQKANVEHAKAALQQQNQKKESIQMTELTKKRKRCKRSDTIGHAADENVLDTDGKFGRCRMKSDPVVHLSQTKQTCDIEDDTLPPEIELKNTNAARDAFRRRSISEDTYDRLPTTFVKERKQTIASAESGNPCMDNDLNSSKSSNSGGVVCSNEDLQDILTCYKMEKTPAVGPSRTVSVEVSKYPRQSCNSQSSYTTQSSRTSYISQTSVASLKSVKSDTSDSAYCDNRYPSRLNSTNSSIHIYPEVILDSSKENPMAESIENEEDIEHQKEGHHDQKDDTGDENKAEKLQQPPEIIFDELGQTWDVYGAEFDPEILGGAIQKHLEKLMRRNEDKSKLCDSSGPSSNGESVHETYITESRSKSFVAWWRFLCLFGTQRKPAEPTMC